MTRIKLALAALAVAAVGVASAAQAAPNAAIVLNGQDGPGFTITLKKGSAKVTKLTAGKYLFVIADKSNIHNFHLKGPGVNKTNSVTGTGTQKWLVTLKPGKYTYVCDPHAAVMKGSFTVA